MSQGVVHFDEPPHPEGWWHAQDLTEASVAAQVALAEIARDEGPVVAFVAGISAEMWLRAMDQYRVPELSPMVEIWRC